MKETKTNKPLFDFKKKYTKRSIAEFLLTNGVDKSTTRHTNTPERLENEIQWMCKGKLCELEKMAKLYNASLLFGGEGSYDRWANDVHQNGAYGLVTKQFKIYHVDFFVFFRHDKSLMYIQST